MVWAFSRTVGRLVRIEPGMAPLLRRRCHFGELICPVADCASPSFTTVVDHFRQGTSVPAGFRHVRRPQPSHEPESLLHIIGKLVVARWLAELGWSDIGVERKDTQSLRRPDVTAVSPTGERVAVEVQYSQLTVEEWQRRDTDLRTAGWQVFWLWGRGPGGSRRSASATRQIHRLLLGQDRRPWRIDPEKSAFGISVATWTHPDPGNSSRLKMSPERDARHLHVKWVSISEVQPRGPALWHPQIEEFDKALAEARARTLAAMGERIRALAEKREARSRRDEQRSGARPDRGRRAPPHSFALPPACRVGDDPSRIGVAPNVQSAIEAAGLVGLLQRELPNDWAIFTTSFQWHAEVLWELRDEPAGALVPMDRLIDVVRRFTHHHHPASTVRALQGFLDAVAAATNAIARSGHVVQIVRPWRETPKGSEIRLTYVAVLRSALPMPPRSK
jgi:hypothetical protein